VTRYQDCCREDGHRPPLMTPPYHPELQPIEELWRDVKCSVAGTRTMTVLRTHVEDAFREYGTAAKTKNKMKRARECEIKHREEGVYAEVIDLTGADESDDEYYIIENDTECCDYIDIVFAVSTVSWLTDIVFLSTDIVFLSYSRHAVSTKVIIVIRILQIFKSIHVVRIT
jgi:hypothetical protein